MQNGFRDGVKVDDILNDAVRKGSMSKEELEQIKRQREFSMFERGTPSWNIFLQIDQLRKMRDKAKDDCETMLWHIKNLKTRVRRIVWQLQDDKNIYDELKPGIKMTKDELGVEKELNERKILGISKDIVTSLATLRNIVGHIDVAKQVVITEKEFNEYVKDVEKRLRAEGYELFDKNIG
jgi:hypothetical protein